MCAFIAPETSPIISEDLKQAMEAEGLTGTRFVEA
jgi:hypothetical protein